MYSSRQRKLLGLIFVGAFGAGVALGQPAAPPAGESASAAQTPNSADEPRFPPQSPVEWDAEIEQIVAQRYPKSVAQLRRIESQVKDVVAHARPAVVAVQLGDSVGSGVIVSPEGLVLTAGHVAMKPHQRVQFRFPDGSRARGVTLGVNQSIDSGMMKITDPGPWPFVKVAESNSLQTGDWVVCLGQPNGFMTGRAPPVRLGRVLLKDDEVVNTDCTLVGGDSGGPLLNLRGEVVGIHSRIGRRLTSNFHVPISTYRHTWDRLLAGELWGGGVPQEQRVRARPLLGVAGNPRETPCRLTQVFPGMPAARAGIQVGDVITQVGEEKIDSFFQLAEVVMAKRPNAKLTILIDRDGEQVELTVRLGQGSRDFPGAAPLESEDNE